MDFRLAIVTSSLVCLASACASSDVDTLADAGTGTMDSGTQDAGIIDASTRDSTMDARTDAATDASLDASTTDMEIDSDAGTMLIPVYYVRDIEVGMRLYREFRRVPATDDPVRAAIEAMLDEPALDPDYESLWPAGTSINAMSVAGAALTLDLSSDALTPVLGSEAEGITLQQLVYTVTAADNSITSVELLIDGEEIESLWGHVDTSGPMTRAPRLDVLAPVWIIDPQEGDQVTTLTISGDATVFEGTVSYSVERACLMVGCDDEPFFLDGHTSATEGGPGRGTWSASIVLPDEAFDGDGMVRISAWEASAKDGSVRHLDDKVIKVVR